VIERWRPSPREIARNGLIGWAGAQSASMAWAAMDWMAIDAIDPDQHPAVIFERVREIMHAAVSRSDVAHGAAYAMWRETHETSPDLDSDEFYRLWRRALLIPERDDA
jgi:hypothetical protein